MLINIIQINKSYANKNNKQNKTNKHILFLFFLTRQELTLVLRICIHDRKSGFT